MFALGRSRRSIEIYDYQREKVARQIRAASGWELREIDIELTAIAREVAALVRRFE
jgi:hypothetical protein